MRTTLTLLLSRFAASTSGAAMSRKSASVSASRRIEGPSSAAATGLALARPSTSASISIRTKRESGELIVCPSHRRSERRMKAWLAPVHPNVRCHQPRRGPSPEASASSLSAVGTGASAAAQLLLPARPSPSWLGTSAPALPAWRLLRSPAGSASAGSGLGRGDDLGRLVRLLRSRPAGFRLRLRRSFDFRNRWLVLDRALDHGRAVRLDESLRARHLQRQRRCACPGGAGACDRQSEPLRLRAAVRQSPLPCPPPAPRRIQNRLRPRPLEPLRPRGGRVRVRPGACGDDGGPDRSSCS